MSGQPTAEQRETRTRNWRIFRLRSVRHSAQNIMDPDLAQRVQVAVDEQLERLGAESQLARVARWRGGER